MAYLALPVFWGLFASLLFFVDRLVAPLVPGFWATLVFPTAWTAIEFLDSRVNPYGTWGATGYTQHGVLPLMQLASVTGVWGIGFLIGWLASVVNWAWDQQFVWSGIQHGVLIFAGVGSAVLLFGGLRIAFAPERQTVRIAGIGWPKGIIEPAEFRRAVEPDFTDAEREKLRPRLRPDSEFISCAEPARGAGRIEDYRLAGGEPARLPGRRSGVYGTRPCLRARKPSPPRDGNGHRPLRRKAHVPESLGVAPADGRDGLRLHQDHGGSRLRKKYSLPGDKPIPFADTEFGRIASPICYDMDFDGLIRQIGRGNADLMLVPASDWKDIIPLRQPMAEFRAIENSAALFRITRWGGSGAVDPYGRRLAWMDGWMDGWMTSAPKTV